MHCILLFFVLPTINSHRFHRFAVDSAFKVEKKRWEKKNVQHLIFQSIIKFVCLQEIKSGYFRMKNTVLNAEKTEEKSGKRKRVCKTWAPTVCVFFLFVFRGPAFANKPNGVICMCVCVCGSERINNAKCYLHIGIQYKQGQNTLGKHKEHDIAQRESTSIAPIILSYRQYLTPLIQVWIHEIRHFDVQTHECKLCLGYWQPNRTTPNPWSANIHLEERN